MTVISIIVLILGLLERFVSWSRDTGLISIGQDRAISEIIKQMGSRHDAAVDAREALDRAFDADPDRVRDDDPDNRRSPP